VEKQIKLTDNNILFLDISSTCTGYAVGFMNLKTKEATISKAGVIWFGNDWDHGKKYNYLQNFVMNTACTIYQVFDIVAEAYMVNKKRMMGTLVIPEATGAIKASCYEVNPPLGFEHVYPQSWRKLLGIKKNTKFVGTKAWKEPSREKVEELFPGQVPDKLMSNITGKLRPTPYDIYDVLCISCAWFTKHGATKFTLKEKFK